MIKKEYLACGLVATSLLLTACGGDSDPAPVGDAQDLGEVVVEETTADQALTEEGMTEDGMIEDGMIEDGMIEDGMTEESMTEESMTIEDMTIEDMTIEDMTIEDMTIEDMIEESMIEESMIEESMIEESMTEEGMTEEGMTIEDMTEESMIIEDMIEDGMNDLPAPLDAQPSNSQTQITINDQQVEEAEEAFDEFEGNVQETIEELQMIEEEALEEITDERAIATPALPINQFETDTVEEDTESAPADLSIELEMLAAVNQARSNGRNCGNRFMPAVEPLALDAQLNAAAQGHNNDMANVGFFSHTGSDGLSVGQRVSATGYNWSSVGENIARGQTSVDAVMDGWLKSPGHCVNIMSANFTEFGMAHNNQNYWTQVFASPR